MIAVVLGMVCFAFSGENAAGDEEWRVNAPPLCDICELPGREEVNFQIEEADDHISYLRARASLDLVYAVWWNNRIEEAMNARQPWVELQLAIHRNQRDDWRRRRLVDLRDLIGPVAYQLRQIPPSVSEKHRRLFYED